MLSIRCIFYFSQADFFAFVFQVDATVNERYVYTFFFFENRGFPKLARFTSTHLRELFAN